MIAILRLMLCDALQLFWFVPNNLTYRVKSLPGAFLDVHMLRLHRLLTFAWMLAP